LLCYSGKIVLGFKPHLLLDDRLSDPDILLRCPLATRIPRIEHAAGLDQEQFDLVLGVRFVLHSLRNDEHLSRPDMHRPLRKSIRKSPSMTMNVSSVFL